MLRPPSTPRQKVSPSQVPILWSQAQAVCFDVDCTITKQDALDDLAEFLGKGHAVRQITHQAMNGDMDLDLALQERLKIMAPIVDSLQDYILSNPAEGRLVDGIQELVQELQARNVPIYLISGGFRELILPVADLLKIPRNHIYANRFVYMADDDGQIRVHGFDPTEPTSHEGGKPEAIRRIRSQKPFQTIVMIGDGITDLEAVQETGGADLFIGFGGVIERAKVIEGADWFVNSYQELIDALPRWKVAMIGSGAFASSVAQMITYNVAKKATFNNRVDMYVYDEPFGDTTLSKAINTMHENPKFLPGVKFGENLVANPDLQDTVKDADLLVFCAPHQFLKNMCQQIQTVVKPTAKAISLTKGIHISPTDGPQLLSTMIRRMLQIECCVMMGANLANEIRPGGFCESTIGSHSTEDGEIFKELLETDYFSIRIISDTEGAELAGALKNVVAIASGFCDGCDLGENCKAAILRQGLEEMRELSKRLYPTVRDETFWESCGVADLIATCYGGRNHLVSQEYAKRAGKDSFEQLEKELLNGQKLQGVLTSSEVQAVLQTKGWQKSFPLFVAVDAIVRGLFHPKDIVRYRTVAAEAELKDLHHINSEPSLLEKRLSKSMRIQNILHLDVGDF
ncbi:phosphoserine phosphatase [Nitzschia inconspicua]|uniref:glycerol-3-phosphate dehydrogenase (NAD(+)) n=1 Tax=Nitzschia inconspicua TaxID=303405 RepID=A0A9K3Q380_9STRA|nr:phosphoserine phosphatase [Nitzschia inconspicua]